MLTEHYYKILKVIASCETLDQLRNAEKWSFGLVSGDASLSNKRLGVIEMICRVRNRILNQKERPVKKTAGTAILAIVVLFATICTACIHPLEAMEYQQNFQGSVFPDSLINPTTMDELTIEVAPGDVLEIEATVMDAPPKPMIWIEDADGNNLGYDYRVMEKKRSYSMSAKAMITIPPDYQGATATFRFMGKAPEVKGKNLPYWLGCRFVVKNYGGGW